MCGSPIARSNSLGRAEGIRDSSVGVEPSREIALSIFQHIHKVLAPFNRIRRIEFADLPKTISGKIRRVELRHREAANVQSGRRPAFEFREEDFAELE